MVHIRSISTEKNTVLESYVWKIQFNSLEFFRGTFLHGRQNEFIELFIAQHVSMMF